MALAGGLQYIDNLALRFSLHGLEDTFAGKPTFCLSWSEPFDLDSVAGKLVSNPKRSRSFPITHPKRIPESAEKENANKREQKRDAKTASTTRINSVKEPQCIQKNTTRPLSETRSTCAYTNMEEESSDEELCDIMLEQENIQINQDILAVKRPEPLDSRGFDNSCEKRKQSGRKRYLEELDTYPSGHAKRPRPRLDFDKVLLSKTNYCEEEGTVSKRASYFAPIVGSDTEDNS